LAYRLKVYDQFAGLRIDWHLDNSAKTKLELKSVTVFEANVLPADRLSRGYSVLVSGFIHGITATLPAWCPARPFKA